MVRSPAKLVRLLEEKGISQSTISSHLTIIEGKVQDLDAVKRTLVYPNQADRLTDIIVSGIGGKPQLKQGLHLRAPVTLDNPNICKETTRNILEALASLKRAAAVGKPMVVVISTTGISKRRDVPLAFYTMYHWLLAVPHEDKKVMEQLFDEAAAQGESSVIRGFVSARASLLVDGKPQGLKKVRVGWESENGSGPGPAIGYTITREDVGAWVFDQTIRSEMRDQWIGRKVTLTS